MIGQGMGSNETRTQDTFGAAGGGLEKVHYKQPELTALSKAQTFN